MKTKKKPVDVPDKSFTRGDLTEGEIFVQLAEIGNGNWVPRSLHSPRVTSTSIFPSFRFVRLPRKLSVR